MTTREIKRRKPRYSERERFWMRVDRSGDCWLWLGGKAPKGYGTFRLSEPNGNTVVGAHRYAYELLRGPIPDGLHLDHLCRNPSCVNPDHLEPVTQRENTRRGRSSYAYSSTCRRGHDLTDPANRAVRKGDRIWCQECRRQADRRRREERATPTPTFVKEKR